VCYYFILQKATLVSHSQLMFGKVFPKLCRLCGKVFKCREIYSAILMENTCKYCGELLSILSIPVSIVTNGI